MPKPKARLKSPKHFPAVPGEVGGVGAEGGLGREGEAPAVEVAELEVRAAGQDGFDEVGLGDADAEVVANGPEACIEEVMEVGVSPAHDQGGKRTMTN